MIMSKYYQIERLDTSSENYIYMVFSKSYASPMDEIEELELELKGIGAKGKIIFDLLLSNGDSPDRYFEAEFDGMRLIEDSLKRVDLIPNIIRVASVSFYKKSNHLLENSVLSRQKKFLLRKSYNSR